MTDPRNDPRLDEPVTRRPDSRGGMWGWIAGIAVLVLIAIILIAGWNNSSNVASNTLNPKPAATTGSAVAPVPTTPPAATTGAAPTTQPAKPATPVTPAPTQH
jgi:hypothetical protein